MYSNIEYIEGDATSPIGDGNKIIVHCCNNIGAWGAGFVLALSKKWTTPESSYKKIFKSGYPTLGDVQFVSVEQDIMVANLIGQHGLRSPDNPVPVSYEAIRAGFKKVAEYARAHQASIHMPRIGCGLAGGSWEEIETLILEELSDVSVTVYDLPRK